MDQTAVITKHQ